MRLQSLTYGPALECNKSVVWQEKREREKERKYSGTVIRTSRCTCSNLVACKHGRKEENSALSPSAAEEGLTTP